MGLGRPSTRSCPFFVLLLVAAVQAARYRGEWSTQSERVRVVAKFGFQETRSEDKKGTRGFVFGNVTSNDFTNSSRPVLFALVPHAHFTTFVQLDSDYLSPCSRIMQNLSAVGFESRCFKDGERGDIFRWVPCPPDQLCREEEDPTIVLPNSQLTIQVEEPRAPEYWYALLIACDLNEDCKWQRSTTNVHVSYDIWMTNGHPSSPTSSLFSLQFSVDEQNTIEMYLFTFVIYIGLCGLVARSSRLYKQKTAPPRLRMLGVVVVMKTLAFALESINLLVFAADGEGVLIFRFLGEILRTCAVDVLCLLLLLVARGWGLRPDDGRAASNLALSGWLALTFLDHLFFLCNLVFVYDLPHQVDVFHSWPGYGMLAVRMTYALWFLAEVRGLITSEKNAERATFLAHFGAGFLVWFVYLLGLGVVASFISDPWRFRIILGIRCVANASATALLLHIFWPTSTNRKFFYDTVQSGRVRVDSEELHDMERLLFDDDSDSEEPSKTDGRVFLHAI